MSASKLKLLVVALLAARLQAQPAPDPRTRSLSDFDIRETAELQTALQPRSLAVDSFLAAAPAGSRVALNRHGLPKLYSREGATLTRPSSRPPEEIAKSFLAANAAIFPFLASDLDHLRLTLKDETPDATFLAFNQTVDGVDVFNGQVRFTLNRDGEIVQAGVGDVIPGFNMTAAPRLSPEAAVRAALRFTGVGDTVSLTPVPVGVEGGAFQNPRGAQFNPITAALSFFPMDAATARLAYRIFVEAGESAWYEVLIDADDGGLLFRHNLYAFAGQARVWAQSPAKGSHELVNFQDEWLQAGATVTTGNNADAFLDLNGDGRADSLNTTDLRDGRAYSASQFFDFAFGDGVRGQDPRNFGPASVTNLFYLLNLAHDYYYSLGFTEAAGNFQTNNFSRGGAGNDAVLGQAQYGGFTNNASFATPAEGTPPRMRMGLFTRGTTVRTDDLDSVFDGHVVLHEYGHGLSNRLVGARSSTSCLSRIQSGAMGEGWSDYFAISFYNEPVLGLYISQNLVRGSRRQSYEGYTFTYEDIGNAGYEAHRDGEIWAAALWDLRKTLGQTTTDKLVVNGLKSTPCNPSMTDAVSAILAADQAINGGANRAMIWQVFARHGLGYSAIGTEGTRTTGIRYDAAYDLPPDLGGTRSPAITSAPPSSGVGMGDLYTYTVAASNPNGGTLSFALSQAPSGMAIDSATGVIQWTAGFVAQRVKVAVTDGRGGRVVHGYLLPISTRINTGTPVQIEGATGTVGYATVDVPAGVPVLQVTLRNGSGDADLVMADPDGLFAGSARNGNSETLSFVNPKAGRWRIEVSAFSGYSGVSLTANLVDPPLLGGNVSVPGLSGVIGSETLFRVSIPPGTTSFQVSTNGGAGDVDLYLRKGRPALCQTANEVTSACLFDNFSEEDGNSESILIRNPEAGDWYLALSGYRQYSGVTLNTAVTVPGSLALSASTFSFNAGEGGAVPPAQYLGVSSTGNTEYVWTAAATSAGNWLQLSHRSGTGNGTVRMSVNASGLRAGTYAGTITVASESLMGSPKTIAVTLRVLSEPVLAVSIRALMFQTVAGQDSPAQAVSIANNGGGTLAWTASAATSSGGNWLRVSPVGNSGNGVLQISVGGAGLTAGSYAGAVTIAASGAASPPVVVPVTLAVSVASTLPTISPGGLVGGAGTNPPVLQISPSGYATIYGTNFAPAGTARQVRASDLVNGILPTNLAGLCIDVDGIPAYLTYVGPNQVNFQVPAVATNAMVTVQAKSNCGTSDERRGPTVTVLSQAATPEFLYWMQPPDGRNPVIAVDSATGAYVGPSGLIAGLNLTPAKPGNILTIYGVSFGVTSPSYAAGTAPNGAGAMLDPATVRLGTIVLAADDILYAGVSPGTAGLYQLNIRVPVALANGNYPLSFSVGGVSAPTGYLSVQSQ